LARNNRYFKEEILNMATHGILIPSAIAAKNVDSFNRSAICASDLDNGNAFILGTKSTTSGEAEVWTATVPNSGTALTGLWMAYGGDEVVLTDSRYKGIDPDPRNFYNLATKVFSAFKPQLGDIIVATADCFYGTKASASYTHVNASNAGGFELEWGTSQTGSVLSFKYLATTYISIGTGAIDNQRVVAYEMECVGL
jgi:hypothetical protein